MTESGTPPPRGHHPTIIPAAGRPASEGEIPRERFGFMRDASKELIEFESVAQPFGRSRPRGDLDGWAQKPSYPAGIVRGETNTSLLPKALAQGHAAPLPKVLVREESDTEPTRDVAQREAPVPTIPGLGDELVIGGPEPADWVRLPDPRAAPTQPSIRRRVPTAARVSPDAPTPMEPNVERRRERLRNVVALSIGAFVAVIGLSSLVVTSLVSGESLVPPPPAPPVRAIEAARAAAVSDDIPPPPAPSADLDETSVASEEDTGAAEPGPLAPPTTAAVTHAAVKTAEAAAAFGKPMAPTSAPSAPKPLGIVRVQSGLKRSSSAPGAPASLPRSSSASSTQPKKRLWFPPE